METIKDRLIQFIEKLGTNNHAFEVRCGFANGYINNLKTTPTLYKLNIIADTYPELNMEWLQTGRGVMMNTAKEYIAKIDELERIVGVKEDIISMKDDVIETLKLNLKLYKEKVDDLNAVIRELNDNLETLKEELDPERKKQEE